MKNGKRQLFNNFLDFNNWINNGSGEFELDEEIVECWEDDNYVIAVSFSQFGKLYHYFTDRDDLKKGQTLTIYHGEKSKEVFMHGYSNDVSKVKYDLDIREVSLQSKRKKPFKKRRTTMRKSAVIESTKESLNLTKDTAIKMQSGLTIISTIKTSLLELETIPEKLKELLQLPGYSDLAIGSLLNIAASTFTDSEIIQKAAEDANFAGAVEFSKQFTLLQDVIEGLITKTLAKKGTKKTQSKSKK